MKKTLAIGAILSVLAASVFGFLLISHDAQNHAAMTDCVAQKIMGLACVAFDPLSWASFHINFLKYFSIALIVFGAMLLALKLLFSFLDKRFILKNSASLWKSVFEPVPSPSQMRLLSWLSFHIVSPSLAA